MSYQSGVTADTEEMTEVQRQILDVSQADAQVLTFTVGEEKYCVDIDTISEVLWNEHELARVPDMDDHVVGVANLRGRSVAVIDPTLVLDRGRGGSQENIVLFEPQGEDEQGYAWLVDTVEQVLSISSNDIDDSVADDKLQGIIERNDELIMWVTDDCFNDGLEAESVMGNDA